ncbi:MAG: ester cyclase [Phycisphaeraceae bacterium]|nr:MAG: ester cyclase [Phycisphaeraceae bacterium]
MKQTHADHIRAANEALLADGSLGAVAEYFAPTYLAHIGGRARKGHRFIKSFVNDIRASFPDLRVDVEILLCKGDRVAWQRTLRGTHRAEFKGFPPTGRKITWHDMVVSRFEDGLIAEDWAISDLAEQLLAKRV